MAAGRFIGGIRFGVSMDTKKLQRNIKSARKSINGFVKGVGRMTLAVTGLGTALSAVGLAAFTKEAFTSIDSLAKTSDKLGVATEALAGLRLAAEETGAGVRTMDMGLQRMVRRVSEAANGTGEARGAIKELGLDAKELAKLSPDEQFRRIAEAMQRVGSDSDQVRLAFKLFDSEGVALVNTLRLGRDGLDEAAQAAKDLGLAVDRDTARGVERAIDAFNRLKSGISGVFRSVAIEIAPVIEGISQRITNFLAAGGKARSAGEMIGQAIIKMADVGQKAFAGLLRFAAMGLDVLNQFRGSNFAKNTLGLETPSVRDFERPLQLRNTAAFLEHDRNLPSAMVARFKAEAEKNRTDTAQRRAGEAVFSVAKGVTANVGQSLASGFMANIKAAGAGVKQVGAFGLHEAGMALRAKGAQLQSQLAALDSRGVAGSLAFARTGSAESFRQQAQFKRDRQQEKLNMERNSVLKEIRDNQKQQQQLAVAHF